MRTMGDKIRDANANAVVVFASVSGEKVTLFTAVGKEAQSRGANAGTIVKVVAQLTGGNGGGKPDAAMAGAKDISKLDEALAQARDIIAGMIK